VTRVEAVNAKVERADKHITDLSVAIARFLATNPYKVGSKNHPVLEDATAFFVENAKPTPPDISVIAGDVIHNLRSALDHLAWHLVEASGKTPGNWTGFPIFDPDSFKTKKDKTGFFERKVQGMNSKVVDAIKVVKPYKGGNNVLWTIHNLNIVDKHHLLLAVGFTSPHFTVRRQFDIPLAGWYPIKEGDNIVTITHKVQPEEQLEFAFDIVLGENGIFQGTPLLVSLSTMRDAVKNLLFDFSHSCSESGFKAA